MNNSEGQQRTPLYPESRDTHGESDIWNGLVNSARTRFEALLQGAQSATDVLTICEALDELKAGGKQQKPLAPRVTQKRNYTGAERQTPDSDRALLASDRALLVQAILKVPELRDQKLDHWRLYEYSDTSRHVVLYWDYNGFSTCYISCQRNVATPELLIYQKTNEQEVWRFEVAFTPQLQLNLLVPENPSETEDSSKTGEYRRVAERTLQWLLNMIKG